MNYCHNCGWHSMLADGTYCGECLRFFYANGRLPRATDHMTPATTMETLYASLGWDAK